MSRLQIQTDLRLAAEINTADPTQNHPRKYKRSIAPILNRKHLRHRLLNLKEIISTRALTVELSQPFRTATMIRQSQNLPAAAAEVVETGVEGRPIQKHVPTKDLHNHHLSETANNRLLDQNNADQTHPAKIAPTSVNPTHHHASRAHQEAIVQEMAASADQETTDKVVTATEIRVTIARPTMALPKSYP